MSVVPRAVSPSRLPVMPRRSADRGYAPRADGHEAWAERSPRRTVVRLWIPATPILWLLSPIPLVLAPLLYLAPPWARPANPYAAVLAVGRVLTAHAGLIVDVDTPDCLVRIRIA